MFAITTLSFLPEAKAETKIISMTPTSGDVGTKVQLMGNMSTENGQYLLQFDEVNITSGNAEGYEVDVSFNITSSFVGDNTFAGDHNVTLIDVTAGENDTTTFTVLTTYDLETDVPKLPEQRQEGDNVAISINVTGGEQSETFVANITVQAPTNASYTKLLNVTTSNNGSGNATVNYPEHFPTGANTNFTGKYRVFLNRTNNETLATANFTIGLTNSTEYHRFQLVDVKAAGYKSDENATITVSFGEEVVHSKNVTAEMGIIHYANWTIPSNASIGTYTTNITSISPNATIKTPPDLQNFTVPGFAVNITTRNLAKEPVPSVTVQVFENSTSVVNATSDSNGLASVMLEIGNYTGKAYLRGEEVGERWINITDAIPLDFLCTLTNLRTQVIDEDGIRIPEVKIFLTPENLTLTTTINGTAVAHSLLPNVTYILNASRYDEPFNLTTISGLLVNETAVAWFNVTIICPKLILKVNVTDAKGQPIGDAVVKVQEQMGGLHYESNTTSEGVAFFNSTFGRFRVEVYAKGIKLNETDVALFQNQNISILCKLYGLTVSIKVTDYFGQPISNANVTLQREGLSPRSNRTRSDGAATFQDIIGGSLQITVYLNDQTRPCAAKPFFVDESKTIEIKVAKYVLLAGVLVETSQLTTALIIVAAVILILSVEVYRRHRKSQKS